MSNCTHKRVAPEICDQTLGVKCLDCNALLGVCWSGKHFSEELWNRACLNDPEAVPCPKSRTDHCGLCGEVFCPRCDPDDGCWCGIGR